MKIGYLRETDSTDNEGKRLSVNCGQRDEGSYLFWGRAFEAEVTRSNNGAQYSRKGSVCEDVIFSFFCYRSRAVQPQTQRKNLEQAPIGRSFRIPDE